MASYPPEPWHLRGQMYLSCWLLPRARLPELPAAAAGPVRPIQVAGRAVVGTAWVRYEPGGVLHYRELLSAVLVRVGRHPAVSILDIWVDSEPSRAGGRELWGIPKELADFAFRDGADVADPAGRIELVATTGGDIFARALVAPGGRLPGRWPFGFSVAQALPAPPPAPGRSPGSGGPPAPDQSPGSGAPPVPGRSSGSGAPPVPGAASAGTAPSLRVTPVRGRAGLRLGSAEWAPAPGGPLGYLAGRRPWLTLCLTDFRLTFGRAERRR